MFGMGKIFTYFLVGLSIYGSPWTHARYVVGVTPSGGKGKDKREDSTLTLIIAPGTSTPPNFHLYSPSPPMTQPHAPEAVAEMCRVAAEAAVFQEAQQLHDVVSGPFINILGDVES